MEKDHPYYDNIVKDERYKDGPSENEFPMYESLKLTIERTLPYWNDVIVPQMKSGKKILVAAHGNSLRYSILSQLSCLKMGNKTPHVLLMLKVNLL